MASGIAEDLVEELIVRHGYGGVGGDLVSLDAGCPDHLVSGEEKQKQQQCRVSKLRPVHL